MGASPADPGLEALVVLLDRDPECRVGSATTFTVDHTESRRINYTYDTPIAADPVVDGRHQKGLTPPRTAVDSAIGVLDTLQDGIENPGLVGIHRFVSRIGGVPWRSPPGVEEIQPVVSGRTC